MKNDDQLRVALDLLARTLPHLDHIATNSLNNYDLRQEALYFLAGAGYPHYLIERQRTSHEPRVIAISTPGSDGKRVEETFTPRKPERWWGDRDDRFVSTPE